MKKKRFRVETTFSLARFDTFERLDDIVNRFCAKHEVVKVEPFNHNCSKCEGDLGYMIVYLDKNDQKDH